MAEPTLYLFDGHNLLHAGEFSDHAELEPARHVEPSPSRVRDRLDPETAARLERLRRGLD